MVVGNERVGLLMYADNIIVMNDSSDELQDLLDVMNSCREYICVSFRQDNKLVPVLI